MANTLKFGAGQWATKEGSTLAYNDENDNYKPLPFDFTRASSATVVNKAGLIETVGNAIPRIDFLGNTQGALKLEPQRTNLITYSESFPNSYWIKSAASIQGDPSTAGSEEITNGSFDTDSDWTKGTGWTISGGKAVSNSSVGYQSLSQSNAISNSNGKTFKCNFTISGYSSGLVALYISGFINNSYFIGANGDYEIYIMVSLGTSGNVEFLTNSSGFVGSIDNVSIKEVQGFSAPDGTNNAYKLVEDTSNAGHRIYQGTSASSKTLSFYAKADDRTWVSVLSRLGGYSYFDIENGVLGTIESSSVGTIEAVGNNGWYRCTLYNGHGTNGAYIGLASSDNTAEYQGDGTSGVYIYGAQIEDGSYSTSYIATSGSSVTRLADACSQTTPSGVIGQTEGTLYGEFDFKDNSTGTRRLLCLTDGTTSNRITTYVRTADELSLFIVSGGVAQSDISTTTLTDGIIKYAVSYANNNIKIYLNGTQVGTDTSATIPLTNKLFVGSENGNLPSYFNWINCELYNTALTDQELIALTTI